MSLTHAYHSTPSGWSDDRLREAYDLIWYVQQDAKANGIHLIVERLLSSVEDADTDLAEAVIESIPDDVAGSTLRKQAEHACTPWNEPRSYEDRDAHGLRVYGLTEGDLP